MKKIIVLLTAVLFMAISWSQSPEKMSYQAVIRNNSNVLLTNQTVGIKISIMQDSESGGSVYAESHTKTTNDNGLLNIEIGTGSPVFGDFSNINWSDGPYFIKTEIDPSGGTSYNIESISQLLSVPYALHSKSADELTGAITESMISDLQKYLTAESDPVFVSSPANGITTAYISNWNTAYGWGNHANLYLSNTYVPEWGELTGRPTTLAGYGITDADNSLTNELQTLSIDGSELSISDGNSITLPMGEGGDNWGTQTVVTDETLTGLGIESNPLQIKNGGVTSAKILDGSILTNDLADFNVTGQKIANNAITTEKINAGAVTGIKIAQAGATNGQTLKWNGTFWTPGDDLAGSSFWEDTPPYGIRYINGNVGIGQTPHRHKLTIYDDDNSQIGFYNSTSGTSGTDGFTIGTTPAGSPVWIWNWENSNMHFATNNTRRFDILANGTIIIWKNLNIMTDGGISNAILISDDEALWYNGTYFSWGYGGDYNYFADPVTIKAANVPGYDLVVNGTAAKTGGGSWSNLSDSRLKNVLGNFTKGLNEIIALQPVRFTYKNGNPRQLSSEEEQVGFIAQEVQKIFPEAVNQCPDGYLDFNMHSVNVALVNAVKELKTENNRLKEEIDQIKSRLEKIER